VKANGEIISMILSSRDETVFAVSTSMQHADLEWVPIAASGFTLGSRQHPSQPA
jgi:hypothetical protein